MSKIGKFEFSASCELQVVNGLGGSAPLSDDCEFDLEVTCTLHCDDPDDGVFGEDIKATIVGTDIELGQEAIELLDLTNRAGEVFMDTGVVHPKRGAKYMDVNGRIWAVIGSGMHHEQAHDYTMLESRIPGRWLSSDPYRRMVVETNVLVCPAMIPECEHEDEDDCTVAGCASKLMFRRVIEEDEPGEGVWRDDYAVYVGKPESSKAADLLSAPVSLEPGSRGLGVVDGKTVADRAKEEVAKARVWDGSDKCPRDHGK